jgi:hypothetical protein
MKNKDMVHVYCMPGLAANPSIFEYIALPQEKYQIHWLDWLIPEKGESLKEYSSRLCKMVKHHHPVLIGVSFGGIIVQEMSLMIETKRTIIISSVKCRSELPRRMRFAQCTKAFKILPTSLVKHVDYFEKIAIGDFAKKRAKLYKQYLSITDPVYLDWAIENMVCWDREIPLEEVVHVHGDKDIVFPYKYIGDCITVPDGTHVMIINRFRWFNEHLEELIISGKLELTSQEKELKQLEE